MPAVAARPAMAVKLIVITMDMNSLQANGLLKAGGNYRLDPWMSITGFDTDDQKKGMVDKVL